MGSVFRRKCRRKDGTVVMSERWYYRFMNYWNGKRTTRAGSVDRATTERLLAEAERLVATYRARYLHNARRRRGAPCPIRPRRTMGGTAACDASAISSDDPRRIAHAIAMHQARTYGLAYGEHKQRGRHGDHSVLAWFAEFHRGRRLGERAEALRHASNGKEDTRTEEDDAHGTVA